MHFLNNHRIDSRIIEKSLMPASLNQKEIEFVSKLEFCKLASINEDGSPHVTPTWFMYEDKTNILAISTGEKTIKAQNVRKDSRVSVLLDDDYSYVTVIGTAKINSDRDGNKDTETMAIKYMGEESAKKSLPELLKIKHVTIEVTPQRVLSHNV